MADLIRDDLEWMEGDMPFSKTFGDHFYARQDGRAETAHVFIGQNALVERWAQSGDFTIAELGFGTGLNLFETWRQWIAARGSGQELSFVTFEAFPMEASGIAKSISRWPDLAALCDGFLKHWAALEPGVNRWQLDDQTVFEIHVGDAFAGVCAWQGHADAWFLDGFAPARNPAMWSAELMQTVCDHTKAGGTFASYTAAGWVRRNLADAGFSVEKIRGHGTKRDMIRGIKA